MRPLDKNVLPIGTYVLEYFSDKTDGVKDFIVAEITGIKDECYLYRLICSIASTKDDDNNIVADKEFTFYPEYEDALDDIEVDRVLTNGANYWILNDSEVEEIVIENI